MNEVKIKPNKAEICPMCKHRIIKKAWRVVDVYNGETICCKKCWNLENEIVFKR